MAVKLERLTKHTAVAVCLNEYMDEDGPENIKWCTPTPDGFDYITLENYKLMVVI